MKKLFVAFMALLLCFLSVGCQKKSNLEENANQTIIEDYEEVDDEAIMEELKSKIKPYQRDSSKGKVVQITLDEMEKKIKDGDTFAICFVTTFCSVCQSFHEILDEYLPNHHLVLYQVVLDEEEASTDENAALVQRYFKEFHTTPGIFYVANGRNVSYYDLYQFGMDETLFDIWVQQNQIDKKQS